MAVPHAVLASGWIPFLVVTVVMFIFSWIYIRYFQHHEVSEVSTTIAGILGLFVTLLTSALVPVDVFLVSFMKEPSGEYKNWAKDVSSQHSIQDTVLYGYYVLYGLVALFAFLILPFMYFYFEEKDDETPKKQRICDAMKYTVVFLLIAFVTLIVGAVVPLKSPPKNMTRIDDKLNFLKLELEGYSNAEKSISILIGFMSMIGSLLLCLYLGFGMAAMPIGMMRTISCQGKKEEEVLDSGLTKQERDEERGRRLRFKANSGRTLTRWEKNELKRIDEEDRLRKRMERNERKAKGSLCGKVLPMFKPFEFIFGIGLLLLSLLVIISFTICNVDKILHSPGYKYGYFLAKPRLPAPLNMIMVYAQQVFPLDYILFGLISLFFVLASMKGIQRIGIWCFCIRMYRIKAHRTQPQALLLMVFMLMFIVLALNTLFLSITPEYVTFGNQKFQANETVTLNGTVTYHLVTRACNAKAPAELCPSTQLSALFNKLFYHAWFFGAFFYWSGWLFVAVYWLGILVSCCRRKTTAKDYSDEESSDEDPLLV